MRKEEKKQTAKEKEQDAENLKNLRRIFDKMTREEQSAFIQSIGTGKYPNGGS